MSQVIVDDFEDGDIIVSGSGWGGWSGAISSLTADGTSPINGSFSGELVAGTNDFNRVRATRSSETTNVIQVLVRVDDTPGDSITLRLVGDGNVLGRVAFTAGGDITHESGAGTTTVTTYTTGTVYRIGLRSDGSNFTSWVDGTQTGPESALIPGTSGSDEFTLENDNDPSAGSAVEVTFDDLIDGPQVDTPALSVTSQSDATTDFSWTNVTGEDGYELYRSSSTPVTTSDTLADTLGADVTTTSDTAPDRDQVWYYALRATSSGEFVDSDLSNEVQTDAFGDPTIAVDATGETSIDLSVTYPPNAEEIDIYRSTTSGVTTGDTLVTTLTGGTTYTDTGLTNGEEYFYAAQARDTDGIFSASELSNEVSATADFPSPTLSSVTDASQTELDCTFSREDNNDSGDLIVVVDGVDEATLSYTATSYTITGLTEATAYDVQIRRETTTATSTSATQTQYTKPNAPDNFGIDSFLNEDVTGSYNDNSSGEDGYRRLTSIDGGSTFSQVGSDLAANTESATWEDLSRPATHTLKVRAFAGSGSEEATADSGTESLYLAPSRATTNGARWLIEIDHSNGNTLRFTPKEGSFTPRLNGLPRFEAKVGFDDRWLSSGFDDAAMRVWKDGRRIPIDTLVERPTTPGETTLKGRGGSQLRREANTSIDQQSVHQTVEDLITTRTDYVANVDDPDAQTSTNTLIQEATSQSEWQNIVASFPDNVPLFYPTGGSGLIRAAQTCFLFMNDGGDDAPTGSFDEESDGTLTSENWEDADVIRLDTAGQYVEFDFDVEHRIDSADLGVAWRREHDDNGGTLDFRVTLNGVEIFDFDVASTSINWSPDFGGQYGSDLRPSDNPHTLRFEVGPTVSAGAFSRLDVGAVYDKRYHTLSNFSNQIETNASNPGYLYLPNPAKYPDEVEVTTQDATPPISLTGARVEIDVGSSYAAKQLELSPDQGSTYPLSATEAETLEGDFGSTVAQARTRITLGARGTGQSETPIDGYASPELLSYRLYADLDDTALFVEENFRSSIEDVLLDGADYADAIWEVQWDTDAETQSLEWTEAGQRTSVAETPISDYSFKRTTEERRDRIRVVGRNVRVVDEAFTADLDTPQQLANEPIQPDSETVESSTTTFTQGQDYTIDWEDGVITTLSSGNITDGESLVISYSWQPLGVADRAGATAPYTVREIPLPGLSTDRECEIAARRIRDATDQPLEEAEVTLPPDAIGIEAIDELQFTGLPTDSTLEVNEIADRAGSQVARLGTRDSIQGIVADIERKLSSTAKNS